MKGAPPSLSPKRLDTVGVAPSPLPWVTKGIWCFRALLRQITPHSCPGTVEMKLCPLSSTFLSSLLLQVFLSLSHPLQSCTIALWLSCRGGNLQRIPSQPSHVGKSYLIGWLNILSLSLHHYSETFNPTLPPLPKPDPAPPWPSIINQLLLRRKPFPPL